MRKTKTMNGDRRLLALLLAAVLGLTFLPGAVQAEESGPPSDVGRGAKAWADNCARCHNMRDPKEFPDNLWRPIVYHMRVRGGLTGQDARDILAYLRAAN